MTWTRWMQTGLGAAALSGAAMFSFAGSTLPDDPLADTEPGETCKITWEDCSGNWWSPELTCSGDTPDCCTTTYMDDGADGVCGTKDDCKTDVDAYCGNSPCNIIVDCANP